MSTIDIAELAIDLRAVTTPDRLDALERLVGASVATRFADALAAVEASAGEQPEDIEIFIDRLDVDCNMLSSWDDATLARALAARVHDEIVRATRSGAHRVFRGRAEYIAALLIALADGQASRCWWFDSFAGLAPVAASNAVRTVVLDEGDAGIAALARLAATDAERIVGGLTRGDAARIVDRIAGRGDAPTLPARVLWQCSLDLRARDDDPHAWLRALVATEREAEGAASERAVAALEAFRSVRASAHAVPAAWSDAAASAGSIDGALERCGVDASLRRCLDAATIADICKSAEHAGDAAVAVVHETPFGGALLLRVVLARTDWRKPWQERMGDFDPALEDRLAWMIVVLAIGSPAAEADPALRLLLPDDDPASLDALAGNAIAAAVDDAATMLLHDFACRVPGCDGASADWLRTNVLAFRARVTSLGRSIDALAGRPPLDVVLVLGGWKRTECRLADGRVLTLREARRDR